MDLKKPAILSISLLTVMTNAAVAPLLGLISRSFPEAGNTLIKQVVTLPSLMIIIFSVISGQLVRVVAKKKVLATGLCLYLISGFGARWASTITSLLIFRALTGAGTGLIIPLAISFITDFYNGKERAEMVGYSTFTSYIGAALAPLLSGWIASSNWQNAFYIYLLALGVLILTMISIPPANALKPSRINRSNTQITIPVILLALLGCGTYTIFYLIPTDISFLVELIDLTRSSSAASLLAIEIIAAASAGIIFSKFTRKLGLYAFVSGFAFLAGGFLLVNVVSSFGSLAICMVIIGLGIGTLRPAVYMQTAQVSPPESTTTAFAFINSGFSLGQFLSPFFFYAISSMFSIRLITGNYLAAGIVFSAATVISLALIVPKQQNPIP